LVLEDPSSPALGDESGTRLGLLLSSPDVTFCIALDDKDLETDRTCIPLLGDDTWLDWAVCGEGEPMNTLVG
jgi:hypothetical protein